MSKRKPPPGWSSSTVGEICRMRNGTGFGPEDWDTNGLPIIRIQNLNGGLNFDYYSGEVDPNWIVEPGQLLFSWAGTRGVSFGPAIWRGPKGVLNQHIFKVHESIGIDAQWLYWALRHVTNRIEGQAHGFKATLLHVKKSDIDKQQIFVPPQAEQRKLASVLAAWEEAITTMEKLLANSKKQKKSLMQRLLTGKRRWHGSSSVWHECHLKQIAQRIQRQSDGADYPVLMISSASGFVRQNQKYSRFMAGKSLDDYILLKQGEFAYNKGNSKLYEFGCVFPLENYSRGLVPHVYVCFALNQQCDPSFFKYLFESDYLHDQLGALVNTGVRNNGLLNIKPADFMNVRVPVPPLNEQQAIAHVLDAASEEIAQRERDLAALREQKHALMQQLLTGKRRVKLDASVAEASAA